MPDYADRQWSSRDGLTLHYRDYPGREDRPPLICLPGLTRNARDFEDLAASLSGEWRVLCPEMRGRGDSAYAKESATYNPVQYVDDVTMLLEEAGIERFVAIGTSLGGMMTMLFALTAPQRLAGALLNDIGPKIEAEGLARIRDYVGQGRSFPTWLHAARAIQETQGSAYPRFEIDDWLRLAKRLMVLGSNDRIVFDYDMKIAEPFVGVDFAAQPEVWEALDPLKDKPVTLIRGALSDVLSAKTFARMAKQLPEADAVTVAEVGHAPTLDEPECRAAIDRLLARVAG